MYKGRRAFLFLLILVSLFSGLNFNPPKASATAGINSQISFQGKLVHADNTNITDGTYNMEFKIYQDGTNTGTGSTLMWTEDYLVAGSTGMPSTGGVAFTSGTFSVNLASICAFSGGTCGAKNNTGVDFNQNTLWLSVQIGNSSACTVTSATTSFNTACGGDGEMSPYIRLTAVPYALNANLLNGLSSAALGQLATNQTWTGTNTFQPATNINSVTIKQTSVASPTADIFNVQTANGTNVLQFTGPAANATAVTVQALGANNISLLTNTASQGVIVKNSVGSTTTFQVQNTTGQAVFGIDTTTNQAVFGLANTLAGSLIVNGGTSGNVTVNVPASVTSYALTLPSTSGSASQCLANSATAGALTWSNCGGATRTVTLVPEYAGATIHASGSSNTGTMTSDYDSSVNPSHNYYQWSSSQPALNSYDVVVRNQIPSEYTSGFGNLMLWVYNNSTLTANNDIKVSVMNAGGVACATSLSVLYTTTANTWHQQPITISGCTFAANDIITVDIQLLSLSNNAVRIGELSYQYTN